MTTKSNGGPAFPAPYDGHGSGDPGMSLRDWFAGQALAGNLGNPWSSHEDSVASRCYKIADAMLKARGANQ